MKSFLKGKRMWEYISGTYVILKNTKDVDVALIDA